MRLRTLCQSFVEDNEISPLRIYVYIYIYICVCVYTGRPYLAVPFFTSFKLLLPMATLVAASSNAIPTEVQYLGLL